MTPRASSPAQPSPTKLLFQLLQCLHHLSLLSNTTGSAVRSFQSKAHELNRFIKPAMPNHYVSKAISAVNNAWVKNMTQALLTHYQYQIDFIQGALKTSSISGQDMFFMTQKAKEWANRNIGKKLQSGTLEKFDKIVKNLIMTKDLTAPPLHPPTSSPPSVPQPCGGLLSGQARDASSVATPKGRRRSGTPDNSPTQTQAPKRTSASPGPDHIRPSYSEAAKSPPSRPPVSPKSNSAPRVFRFPNLKPEQRKGQRLISVWEIPKVIKDTLVLGDSNLSRISWVGRPDAQVVSYPGLKLSQLLLLLQGFKFGFGSPNPGRKPSRVILSVGLNDRGLSPSTNKITLKKIVNEALRIFPGAQICLSQIQHSDSLDSSDKRTISILNDDMKNIAEFKANVLCIPALPKSKFKVGRDNIHWTEDCANATLNHFFQHLN